MKERPILFNAPRVRAILAGTKTQTRRAVKGEALQWLERDKFTPGFVAEAGNHLCPYGQPGEKLWVRETWYCDDFRVQRGPYLKPDDMDMEAARADGTMVYRASSGDRPYEAEQPVWRPAIHMPRWASRITLEITGVRVERLQDISEADARAEGIVPTGGGFGLPDGSHFHGTDPRVSYWSLWESINGPGSVEANPWVWVLEFKRVEAA